jgi:uncharacterized protein YceK
MKRYLIGLVAVGLLSGCGTMYRAQLAQACDQGQTSACIEYQDALARRPTIQSFQPHQILVEPFGQGAIMRSFP